MPLVEIEDRGAVRHVVLARAEKRNALNRELIEDLGEAVQEAAGDPEAVTRFAGRMQTESARLTNLVQQIIELSRLQGDDPLENPQVVDVDSVVSRCIDQSAIDAQSKDIAVLHDGERRLQILGLGDEVALALGNLVANAHRHGRGRVTVEVRADDGWAYVTVADEGPGIPPEQAARAFERFWRAPEARGEGSGLGLAIVRAIAERHGGHVSVEGSRFTLAIKELSRTGRTTTAR
jgi:two-component system sensor histidine kinase SenX3